jgi:IS66 Orf2 like protein
VAGVWLCSVVTADYASGSSTVEEGFASDRSGAVYRGEILMWDRDGYVLWYKRLEVGVFKLPRVAPGSVELRAGELVMLLDGIDMEKLKRVPREPLRHNRSPVSCAPISKQRRRLARGRQRQLQRLCSA